jgi:hypothetical protein
VVQAKLSTKHTYLEAKNYWTPLNDDDEESNDDKEEINVIKKIRKAEKLKGNKWTRRRE